MKRKRFIIGILFALGLMAQVVDILAFDLNGPIQSAALLDELHRNFWTGNMKTGDTKYKFEFEDEKVVWAARVHENLKRCQSRWYAPDGEVFDIRKVNRFAPGIYQSTLEIQGNIPRSKAGRWRVEIMDEFGDVLDQQIFYLGNARAEYEELADVSKVPLDLQDEDALMLLDEIMISVNKEHLSRMRYRYQVLILTEKGKALGQIQIPLIAGQQNIDIDYAFTIRPNGEVVPATEYDVIQVATQVPRYTSSKILAIAMPALEIGSILDFQVTLTDVHPFTQGFYSNSLHMNKNIAIFEQNRQFTLPKTMSVYIKYIGFQNQPQITTNELNGTKTYVWSRKNIPPIKPELMMPPHREIAEEMIISTSDDWATLARWWRELNLHKDFADKAIRDQTFSLITQEDQTVEKVRKIFNYVRENIEYVGFDFGKTIFEPAPAMEVFKKKYGDCKNQSTLLQSMLKTAGIDAHIVLMRTSDLGPMDKTYPAVTEFNHAILMADMNGKKIYLDPTAKHYDFGELPYTDYGRWLLSQLLVGITLRRVLRVRREIFADRGYQAQHS